MTIFKITPFKFLLAAGTILTLGACAGNWDVDAVGALPDKGNAFQAALHKEYVALARMERDEGDWADASYFNNRATAAAAGTGFGPQAIAERALPAEMVAPMTAARESLVKALAAGTTAKPAVAARAQAMFDCWMQEQEENFQPEDIAKCKGDFEAALAQLGAAPMAAPAPKPVAKKPAAPELTVFFAFNSAALSSTGSAVVAEAAAYAGANKGVLVVLKGHADRSGDAKYNLALSERRSAAVAAALTGAGVDASRIVREGHGEYEPAVPTEDGVKNADNRRVTIKFSK